MDVTEIPDEAWRRLVELENAEHDLDPRVGGYGLLVTANREFPTNRAFARYIATAQSEAAELRKEVAKYRDGYADLYHMMNRANHDDAGCWGQAVIAVGNFIYLKFGADFARAALKEPQHEG